MNEEDDWDEKRDIHPGNASKQEDVAGFSHDPFVRKKKVEKNPSFSSQVLVWALYIPATSKL